MSPQVDGARLAGGDCPSGSCDRRVLVPAQLAEVVGEGLPGRLGYPAVLRELTVGLLGRATEALLVLLDEPWHLAAPDGAGQDRDDKGQLLERPHRVSSRRRWSHRSSSSTFWASGAGLRSILELERAINSRSRERVGAGAGSGAAASRGRDGSCDPPPAQIPACPIRAPGSYLG